MISLAYLILDRGKAGIAPTADDLDAVPSYQWDVYHEELAQLCPSRVELPVLRRPANALNVEVGQPAPRCRRQTPPEWNGSDPNAARWLASGGSALVLGPCARCKCPRIGGAQ